MKETVLGQIKPRGAMVRSGVVNKHGKGGKGGKVATGKTKRAPQTRSSRAGLQVGFSVATDSSACSFRSEGFTDF